MGPTLPGPSQHPPGIGSTTRRRRRSGFQIPCPGGGLYLALYPFVEHELKVYVGQERPDYPTYAKDNFCFERVISGWRGALTVLDLRLKK
jgi:hypothetical protein